MSHATASRHAWAEPGVEDLGGGVYRIPLPLPLEGLKAVNVYAITDPGGVDLIDAGIALVPAREQLTAGLRKIGYELGDVRNFFVTHIHIDHYSLAVELRRTFRSVISLGEQEHANLIATREMVNGSRNRFFGAEGLRRLGAMELVTQLSAHDRQPPALIDWEDPDRWLEDGTDLDLRTRTLRAVHTPGHTRGSLCFLVGKHLLSGDTLFPHGPGRTNSPADLKRIIGSITGRLFVLSDDTKVYPGHGDFTILGKEKEEFAVFSARSHDPGLCGDVLWLSS